MAISVDIADRLYDYTDEEKAAEAVVEFQARTGLSDDAIVVLWQTENDPQRLELEKCIFEAVDANGSVRRANEAAPGRITLVAER